MPVWFAPLIFHGLVTAARAAIPHVARMLTTQASYVGARATLASASARTTATNVGTGLANVGKGFGTIGRNMTAATFVPSAVVGAALIADSLGVIPPSTQSGVIPQSLRKPGLPDPDRNLPSGLDTQSGPYSWPTSSQGSAPEPQTVAGTTSAPAEKAPAPEPPPLAEPPDPPIFKAVKAAPIDTVFFVDEKFSQEFITDLLFEDVAGQELLSIARDDTVNGQEVIYQPIKNLGILRDIYDINNLLKIQETSDRFFANFLIRLNEKIPEVGRGANGANYYLDTEGSAIIELINILDDEQVEIQVLNAGIIESIGI